MSGELRDPEQVPGDFEPPLLPQHRKLSDGEQYLILHERLATTGWQVAQRYFGDASRFADAIDDIVHEALVETVAHWRRVRRRGNPEASVVLATLEGCRRWDSDQPSSDGVELERLTDSEREIVVLRDWIGINEHDVCTFLGVSRDKLTKRSLSAAAKLRDGALGNG